ncbi:DUF438 domain-containing protein [Erysipelothrix urinaevulpis]|uniref:DUF438 domain-containing protein n=1 Tax=Erysipelothrix urinaevulpis TaxID=2683717 RepID=UPI001915EA47|nr:DUF438 domain-containing protein [Erysipelothrix urinaevulpis]
MKISIDETFYDVVSKDERLLDFLIDFGFKPMKKKITLETMGKIVTLRKGLDHLGTNVDQLNQDLIDEGLEITFVDEKKAEGLGKLIKELHDGRDPEIVKESFREQFGSVSAAEIIEMEQELVKNGMPISEIQRLCDIHADVFNGSIEEIHASVDEFEVPGHPVHVLKEENRALEELLEDMDKAIGMLIKQDSSELRFGLITLTNDLYDLDKHYKRKEECYFPFLEKQGYTAPSQVMWGVHDEIRLDLKNFYDLLKSESPIELSHHFSALRKRIEDMIFKEEKILLPMIVEEITEDDWLKIAKESQEIGYCLVSPKKEWVPKRKSFYDQVKEDLAAREEAIHFNVGTLNFEELEAILNLLPIHVTFVDKDDTFKYFNQTKGRHFFRSPSQIGRKVQHCHPPKSVDLVEGILHDFKANIKDEESFWIEMNGKLIYIAYYAVRDKFGNYMGTLETSMDIKPFQEIQGQKRLRD